MSMNIARIANAAPCLFEESLWWMLRLVRKRWHWNGRKRERGEEEGKETSNWLRCCDLFNRPRNKWGSSVCDCLTSPGAEGGLGKRRVSRWWGWWLRVSLSKLFNFLDDGLDDNHLHHLAHCDRVHGELPVALPRHRNISEVTLEAQCCHCDHLSDHHLINFIMVMIMINLIISRVRASKDYFSSQLGRWVSWEVEAEHRRLRVIIIILIIILIIIINIPEWSSSLLLF